LTAFVRREVRLTNRNESRETAAVQSLLDGFKMETSKVRRRVPSILYKVAGLSSTTAGFDVKRTTPSIRRCGRCGGGSGRGTERPEATCVIPQSSNSII